MTQNSQFFVIDPTLIFISVSHHRPVELRCGDEVAALEAGQRVKVERLYGGRRRGRAGRRGHRGDARGERVVAGRRRHRILERES